MCIRDRGYGVGTSTVGDWEKNRAHIENFCANMVTKDSLGEMSTTQKAKNEALEDALFL